MIYRVYKYNGTLLGEFRTERQARSEADYYTMQTGNRAYVSWEQL